MALVAKVEILGEYKNLTKATRNATNDVKKMNTKIGGFSKKMRGSLAAIAAGISFGAITRGLEDATKAAMDDRKSQALLAEVLRNSTKATDTQIESVEKQIGAWQNSTGILDDKLRPAYSKLIASTEDVSTANDLMTIALDVSAGTGKDLETVATQLARAQNGNVKALDKLVPGLSDAVDPMGELADKYKGMAETAAENDPLSRIQVRVEDLQEEIGTKLLPYLDDFADWLATEEGSQFLDTILETLKLIIQATALVVEGFNNIQSVGNQVNSDPEVMDLLQISREGTNAGGLENIGRNTTGPNMGLGLPQMAEGGVVLPRAGGTAVNVGEAGQAEAIVPLDRLGNLGGSNQYVININKANVSGKEVVDAIRRYESSNGRKYVS